MRVLVAGDYCPQNRVIDAFKEGDFSRVLGEVKPIVKQFDYSIVNLECPVCNGNEMPTVKCGRNLKCSVSGVNALHWAGFKCVSLANNHFYDYGEEGVMNTINECIKASIDTVGGGRNLQAASMTLYKEVNNQVLAIINCCEHEFSIATNTNSGSNPLNAIQQYYAIKEAREHSDYIIIIIHGGNEHYQLPSPRMQETYRFFIDAGADVVVNHHQHCFSGYEIYKGKPIFYGLGNFCFDKKGVHNNKWNYGYMVGLEMLNQEIKFKIFPYQQCNKNESISLLSKDDEKGILEQICYLNTIIGDSEKLEKEYTKFLASQDVFREILSPYSNRFLLAMYRRHLLPSLFPKKKNLQLLAYVQCESHLPKLLNYLKRNV